MGVCRSCCRDPGAESTRDRAGLYRYYYSRAQRHQPGGTMFNSLCEVFRGHGGEITQINNYRVRKNLGRGTFGVVYLCEDMCSAALEDRSLFAIKELPRAVAGRSVQKEIGILSGMDHPNVVRLLECINDEEQPLLFLVFEALGGGPLCDCSADGRLFGPRWTERKARKHFRQVADGLQYLHSVGVLHRDIKPDNIVFDDELECVKLIDFGESLQLKADGDDSRRETVGTPMFQSPESIEGTQFSGKAADVWALGVTLYLLLVGNVPFGCGATTQPALWAAIAEDQLSFPAGLGLSTAATNLLTRMLDKNPVTRITLPEVVDHSWVTESEVAPRFVDAVSAVNLHDDDRHSTSPVLRASQHSFRRQPDTPSSSPAHSNSDQQCRSMPGSRPSLSTAQSSGSPRYSIPQRSNTGSSLASLRARSYTSPGQVPLSPRSRQAAFDAFSKQSPSEAHHPFEPLVVEGDTPKLRELTGPDDSPSATSGRVHFDGSSRGSVSAAGRKRSMTNTAGRTTPAHLSAHQQKALSSDVLRMSDSDPASGASPSPRSPVRRAPWEPRSPRPVLRKSPSRTSQMSSDRGAVVGLQMSRSTGALHHQHVPRLAASASTGQLVQRLNDSRAVPPAQKAASAATIPALEDSTEEARLKEARTANSSTATLPAAGQPPPATPSSVQLDRERSSNTIQRIVAPAARSRVRLLVVDDVFQQRDIMARMAKECIQAQVGVSFHIDTAEDGDEAVRAVRQGNESCVDDEQTATGGRYTAVLLDIHMPRVSGFDAARRIRILEQQEGWLEVPIFGVTANTDQVQTLRDMAKQAGMQHLFFKPMTPEKMRQVLEWLNISTNKTVAGDRIFQKKHGYYEKARQNMEEERASPTGQAPEQQSFDWWYNVDIADEDVDMTTRRESLSSSQRLRELRRERMAMGSVPLPPPHTASVTAALTLAVRAATDTAAATPPAGPAKEEVTEDLKQAMLEAAAADAKLEAERRAAFLREIEEAEAKEKKAKEKKRKKQDEAELRQAMEDAAAQDAKLEEERRAAFLREIEEQERREAEQRRQQTGEDAPSTPRRRKKKEKQDRRKSRGGAD
eukprot:TRINITY_DN29669_c0_g1_i1.p1 TRINITY_DN29669_c0_g1~~TRINITY_DN29669_c0_g1_i1.p1  ORF type:complete len:1079 (+),score=359.38 TRINITY_DN29669_c0_g1_i1:128-3364(+)